MANEDVSYKIESVAREIGSRITLGMRARAYSAANELRNASQIVLRGQRHGKRYNVPGTGRVRYYKRDSRDGKHKAGTATITYRKYTASAPGEPPAVRFGHFRESWQPQTQIVNGGKNLEVRSYIQSSRRTDNGKYLLGQILEEGTGRMAPRPYKEKIQQKALPQIKKIYKRPYF